ncbi:MAG TPA: hypothetical protein VJ892_00250 [Candidatus Absconditabacterales bacterium]|nr:hypothetical protein [Candidatus Absconditabacterales bacterium]
MKNRGGIDIEQNIIETTKFMPETIEKIQQAQNLGFGTGFGKIKKYEGSF